MDDLPHLIVDEPKRSKTALATIIVVSLMIVLIPAGVYLVSQKTQLVPQAAAPEKPKSLETSLTLSSNSKQAALGGEVGIDVLVRADSDNINLINAKVKFDPQTLKITRIATSSGNVQYFANKWLEAYFDNPKGEAFLLAGVPSPGVKTEPGQSLKLATIYFQPQKLGPVQISLHPASQIFRNSDNLSALQKTNDLEITITEGLSNVITPVQNTNRSSESTSLKQSSDLILISPNGGEEFSYFSPIIIVWNSKNIDKITSLSLLINEQAFGLISSNFSNTNQYQWSPQATLLLPYITPTNTYQIELTALTKKGELLIAKSAGPFGIIAKDQVTFATESADSSNSNFSLTDVSLLLSQFNKELDQSKVDLNKDGLVNQLDLWLLKRYLLYKDIIR